jgi:hypothetical protein
MYVWTLIYHLKRPNVRVFWPIMYNYLDHEPKSVLALPEKPSAKFKLYSFEFFRSDVKSLLKFKQPQIKKTANRAHQSLRTIPTMRQPNNWSSTILTNFTFISQGFVDFYLWSIFSACACNLYVRNALKNWPFCGCHSRNLSFLYLFEINSLLHSCWH